MLNPATRVQPVILCSNVRLRLATQEDRFLVRRWVASPRFAWRESAASAEAEITLAMGNGLAMARIIEHAGEPLGYAQAAEAGLWSGGSLPVEIPAGTWMTDYFLAEPENASVEMGSIVLKMLATEVFSTTLAVACCAVVPISDETAARSCERAGFRWVRVLQEPAPGAFWLMRLERPPLAS